MQVGTIAFGFRYMYKLTFVCKYQMYICIYTIIYTNLFACTTLFISLPSRKIYGTKSFTVKVF